ncbi:hypothetical protein ACFL3H_08650 [Gemmatimonadota bacterium]
MSGSKRRIARIILIFLLCAGSSLATPLNIQAQDRWFGPDKALHFFGAFMATSVGYVVACNAWDYDHDKALRFGVGVGVAASVGKELYDVISGRGQASGKDLVWDGIGIGLGVLFLNALADPTTGSVSPEEIGSHGRFSLHQLSLIPGRPLLSTPEFRVSKPVDSVGRVPTFGLPPGGILRPDREPEGD